MDEQIGIRAVFKDFQRNIPLLRQTARDFPKILNQLTKQTSENNAHKKRLMEIQNRLLEQKNQMFFLGIGITSITSSALIYLLGLLSWPAYILAATGIYCFYKGRPK